MKFNPAKQKIADRPEGAAGGQRHHRQPGGRAGLHVGATDPECAGVFNALQIGWKADGTGSGQPIDRGLKQTVFRAIPR